MPKKTYTEAIVLGNAQHQFTHIFLSEGGFDMKEPAKYVPNTPNVISFPNGGKTVTLQKVLSGGKKEKPSSTNHMDTHLYYYKKQTHFLATFELHNSPDRVTYRDVGSTPKSKLIQSLVVKVNDKPMKEDVNEDFIRIINEAIGIANEKVKPTPPIEPVMF